MRRNLILVGLFLFIAGMTISSCKKDDDKDVDDDKPAAGSLDAAKKDYTDNYLSTKATLLGWTGAVAGCNAGDIDAQVRVNVIKRVNYYRRLVGLPDNVTLNSSQNQICQEAALYMAANQTITHYPSGGGQCYTSGAADAAGHGNVAIGYGGGATEIGGNHSTSAVSGYIEDPGPGNTVVGHRHWILYPQLNRMGTGSVFSAVKNNFSANVLMWGENTKGSALDPNKFVAYPPGAYIPSTLVFPRWSFSIPGASFSSAKVSMKDKAGTTFSSSEVNIIERVTSSGAPDARIVWEPKNINVNNDTEYEVTVSDVVGAAKTSYTYTVKVFKVTQNAKRSSEQKGTREFLSL